MQTLDRLPKYAKDNGWSDLPEADDPSGSPGAPAGGQGSRPRPESARWPTWNPERKPTTSVDVVPLLIGHYHGSASFGTKARVRPPSAPMLVARGFDAWPRALTMASLLLAFTSAILSAGEVVSAGLGLACGFFGLALFFFSNLAAFRRGTLNWIVGPAVAVLGTWGSLGIALAIAVNGLLT